MTAVKFTVCFLILATLPCQAFSATLFESDWATATGTTEDAITDGGYFAPPPSKLGDAGNNWYEVLNDSTAPGGRNFLRLSKFSSGAGGYLRKSSLSLGNPSTLYVRFWFRLRAQHDNGGHLFFLRPDTNYGIDSGCIGAFDLWGGWTNIHTNYGGAYNPGRMRPNDATWSSMDVDDGEWHRWELKIENAGTSASTITIRVDGTDRTSGYVFINDPTDPADSLSTWNGSITNLAANYVEFQVYDTSGGGSVGEIVDITGLKLTDGPDWIGGDDATPARKLNNVTGNRVSLH